MKELNWFEMALAVCGALLGLAMGAWLKLDWTVQAFTLAMFADIATGLLSGGKAGELDSTISWQGMRKKAMMVVLVGLAGWLGTNPQAPFPGASVAAGAFLVTELLSIIENSSRLGLDVSWLSAYLKRVPPKE